MRAPNDLMLALQDKFGIENFIETGTYQGETATWASQNFSRVYTVEYSKEIFVDTSRRLGSIQNIEFIQGKSQEKLREIAAKTPDQSSMFWLDAHYSGGNTAGGNERAPLIEELTFLLSLSKDQFIFVDDARFMLAPLSTDVNEYPDMADIGGLIDTSRYFMYVIDDVIMILPRKCRDFFYEYFHSTIKPRLFPAPGTAKKKKKNILKKLLSAIGIK